MALVDKKIEGSTPIRDFPQKYNGLIDELVDKINELEEVIAEKDAKIFKLRSDFITLSNKLKAEYASILDPDKIAEDGEYVLEVKKTGNKLEYKWVRK